MKIVNILVVVCVLAILTLASIFMFHINRSDEYLASPMQGQLITSDQQPVTGVTVTQRISVGSKTVTQTAITDDQGRFSFPAYTKRQTGLISFAMSEPRVQQRYFAALPSGELNFLYIPISGYELNKETQGKPFDVLCKTDVEPNGDGFHWGTCTLQ